MRTFFLIALFASSVLFAAAPADFIADVGLYGDADAMLAKLQKKEHVKLDLVDPN